MGFFSSRKADDPEHRASDSPSVSKVIRSRFYGKGKGKEREDDFIESYATASRNPSPGMFKQTSAFDSPMRTPSRAHHTHDQPIPSTPSPSKRRATTDTVTLTLAQRLNELSVANSQGFLNDEEYRLLRQDLFDRLASTNTPVENPIVPVTPSPRRPATSSHRIEPQPSPSVRSKGSVRSGVSSLLMRVTTSNTRARSGSQSTLATENDGTSVLSGSSSSFFKRALNRRGSASSMATSDSHPTADISPSPSPSKHRSGSDAQSHRMLRSGSRSQGSMRMLTSPPSSFHIPPSSSQSFDLSLLDDENTERLQTSAEIKAAISAIEAERKRLVDSFNSLEISTLTKHRANSSSISDWQMPVEDSASGWIVTPEPRTPRRGPSGDIDSTSLQSALSTPKSSRSIPKPRASMSGIIPPSPMPAPSTPLRPRSRGPSLSRQTSMASMASTSTKANRTFATPVSSIPTSYSSRSQSSLNLNGHTMVLGSLAEDGTEDNTLNAAQAQEIIKLKKRREEVLKRYDDRAEYLRAKLKGAELREKLMRR